MSQRILLGTALLSALCCVGCVERHFVIQSDPPGAVVYENGKRIGETPLYRPFEHYGTYRFMLVKDGYQTLVVDECIKRPWYQYFPIDFFAENIWPWTIRDVRVLPHTLGPPQIVPPEVLLQRAEEQRQRGHTIGSPIFGSPDQGMGPCAVPPGPVAPPPMPPGGVQPSVTPLGQGQP